MKLLLTSDGIKPSFEKEFFALLNKKTSDISVSFITTAAYGEEDNPIWLQDWKNQLLALGIKKIEDLDLKDKTPEDLEIALNNKDIIFVSGGNTFCLLYWVKKSGFGNIVKKLIKKGVLYVGVSAGSIIMCPTIETAFWEPPDINRVGLTDFSGLNLVNFLITPHFEEKYRQMFKDNAKNSKYPVIALTNQQAILVTENGYKIIGEGKKIEC